jgi:outer membrane protein, heavy metal efflux system
MCKRLTQGLMVLTLFTVFVAPAPSEDRPAVPSTAVVTAATCPALELADFEQMALRYNPTLAQAAANVEAARGRAIQSGLYPNPTAGYEGDRMGAAGTAGEMQGLFIDQTIVTAGKLRLNRAKSAQQISQVEAQALAQAYRVRNGVRIRFYRLLAMQRLLDVRADLLKVAEDAASTSEELFNVGAANKPDVLQARIEARQERVALANARARYDVLWKEVAAFVGQPSLPLGHAQGDLEAPGAAPDYETALTHLLEASPEMQFARADVARSQLSLKREQVEPIPNLQVHVATGYDFDSRKAVSSVMLGARIPLFDRNQGNIRAAQAELARSQAEVARVEYSLRQRLARTYARYRTASETVEAFRKATLPEAKEAYELYLDSFRKRQAAWPQVLVAQRTYFQLSVEYLGALDELRGAETAILGLLLVDGLDEPPASPDDGRGRNCEQGGEGPADPIGPSGGRGLEDRFGEVPK